MSWFPAGLTTLFALSGSSRPRENGELRIRRGGGANLHGSAALALLLSSVAMACPSAGRAEEVTEIKIGYLHAIESKERLSLMDVPAENDAVAGAQLAIDDNNTTGRFVKQHYKLIEKSLRAGDDVGAAVVALADAGAAIIIVGDVDADGVLKAAEAAKAR